MMSESMRRRKQRARDRPRPAREVYVDQARQGNAYALKLLLKLKSIEDLPDQVIDPADIIYTYEIWKRLTRNPKFMMKAEPILITDFDRFVEEFGDAPCRTAKLVRLQGYQRWERLTTNWI